MIWRNFLRDLRQTAPRLISVMVITMIAVMVYTALNGVLYHVQQVTAAYGQTQNVADYWISGAGLDRSDCRVLEQIDGVAGVQPRITWEAQERGNEDVQLLVYAVADWAINTPYLVGGALPADEREMAVSDVFAAANGLSVGDSYEMLLTGTDQVLRLRISGLVKSPECLYHVNATTPMPELGRYGFAYCSQDVLSGLMGSNRYNQICITTSDEVDDAALRRAVDERLGDKVVNVLAREDNLAADRLRGMTEDLTPILRLFPILFFLCAVLLMVSNMSRLIESGRSAIGTFKALGYSDRTILWYYLLHAVLVVLVGFPLGVAPNGLIARLLVETLSTGCDLPVYGLANDYRSWGQALALTVLCCVGSVHAPTAPQKHQAGAAGEAALPLAALGLQSEIHHPQRPAQQGADAHLRCRDRLLHGPGAGGLRPAGRRDPLCRSADLQSEQIRPDGRSGRRRDGGAVPQAGRLRQHGGGGI